MPISLKDYLVRLATNVDDLSDFVSDPHKASEKAGLSSQDQEVLFSGNQSLIYAALTGASKPKRSPVRKKSRNRT
jgi:hypothetical protein